MEFIFSGEFKAGDKTRVYNILCDNKDIGHCVEHYDDITVVVNRTDIHTFLALINHMQETKMFDDKSEMSVRFSQVTA